MKLDHRNSLVTLRELFDTEHEIESPGSTSAKAEPERSCAEPLAPWSMYTDRQRWGYLLVLFLVSTSQYFDRNVISVLLEPIKQEFKVSDTALGFLGGFCFALFYTVAGLPVARWADRGNRRTVITLALTIWSAMTLCCGFARTFWQLAIARIGVGAGESGAIPPAQSLIVDYYPSSRRATAIAIFTSAAFAGNLLGLGLGGYVAAVYGWRNAFLLGGVPGLLLAILARLTLAEPRLQHPGLVNASGKQETTKETMSALVRKRSFLYALGGCLVYFLFAYGVLTFIPSFLIRSLHLSLAEVSVAYALVAASGSLIGTLGGGWLSDRLGRRDVRWLAWLAAIACGLTAPLFLAAFSAERLSAFLAAAFFANLLLTAGVPSIFSAIHAVCGARRRATAIALIYFSASLVGGGMGPMATGALSDALRAVYGENSLRYSLMMMTALLAGCCLLFYRFGQEMPGDTEA